LLFAALSVADGASLALFVKRAGIEDLPRYYAVTAVANLIVVGAYLWWAESAGAFRTFGVILLGSAAVYALTWLAIRVFGRDDDWYGILFVTREMAFTL